MGWMRIPLPPADIARHREHMIQEAFVNAWTAAGVPPDAVMYLTTDVTDDQYCYFTPAAVNIARRLLETFGAEDCHEPDVDELIVMVRNDGAPI
jgi:hypothetical protein